MAATKGQNTSTSGGQVRREQDGVRGHGEMNLRPLRIEVPRFEDGDPQGWIFMIQQYFDCHNATEE